MSHHHPRNEERKEDIPPYSRLFVVCEKELRDDDLMHEFEKFGEVEDLYRPKDRNSGEPRGVAYVKYLKTSSSAAAIRELHLKTIPNSNKPIKVMLATSKNDKNDQIDAEKLNRLFIKVSKQATLAELKDHFSEFGHVDSVHIQKDRSTDESKGLAYVQFKSFYDTAVAYEKCDKKYRAVFATPKQDLKRSRDNFDYNNDSYNSLNHSNRRDNSYDYINHSDMMNPRDPFPPMIKTPGQDFNSVIALCTPQVPQTIIERLFNIVPGMTQFQYSVDYMNGCCKAIVTYNDNKAAVHAIEKINNFEFPSGEIITVKPNNVLRRAASELTNIVNTFKNAVDAGSPDIAQLAEAIAQASSVIKAATVLKPDTNQMSESFDRNFCSVPLPPPQPLSNCNRVAKRCFIVCKPQPPPMSALKDVFRRFGDLIDVSTIPNKTFGFVKYASNKAAQDAINTLHGATVCGMKLKVLEADEGQGKDYDNKMEVDKDRGEGSDLTVDTKRIRLHEE